MIIRRDKSLLFICKENVSLYITYDKFFRGFYITKSIKDAESENFYRTPKNYILEEIKENTFTNEELKIIYCSMRLLENERRVENV